MQEIWKDVNIDEFKNYYQISNLGNVKSKPKTIYKKNNLGEVLVPHTFGEKIMKKYLNKDGYEIVGFKVNNKEKKFRVHTLVALTFIGVKPSSEYEINHIDCNKLNNKYNNLEWVTHRENLDHSNKNKLSGQKQILQIDMDGNLIKLWQDLSEIKKELNFDKSSIVRVCKNKSKRVYGFKWQYA
jgi:hypothetical protein